jgi:hypothetical protein
MDICKLLMEALSERLQTRVTVRQHWFSWESIIIAFSNAMPSFQIDYAVS